MDVNRINDYYVGQKVEHSKYGHGVIKGIHINAPGDCYLDINFVDVHQIVSVFDLSNVHPEKKPTMREIMEKYKKKDTTAKMNQKKDNVNHPSHYNTGEIEVIDFIADRCMTIGFDMGNAIKYLSRAGLKDPDTTIEDLDKAKWYCQHMISHISKKKRFLNFDVSDRYKISTDDYINDKGLSYNIGQALVYISNSLDESKEPRIESLDKAVQYIDREIQRLQKKPTKAA